MVSTTERHCNLGRDALNGIEQAESSYLHFKK